MTPATHASFQDFSDTPLPLLAGAMPTASEKVTLITPENRTRGAVLGRIAGTITDTPWAGNTGGSGTIGTVVAAAGLKEGTYKVMCVEPAANAGAFVVEDPDGQIVGRATVAVEFTGGGITFTISDATDFVVGDGFDIVVAKGTKYKLAVAAATDGSHTPVAILAADADATDADVDAMVFTRGDFNEDALILGAGLTLAGIKDGLRALDINLIASNG
jgi:hypothetical protein